MTKNFELSEFGQLITVDSSANDITLATGVGISANGSYGTSGQALTTNGSAVYWSTITGTDANSQYTWTNVQTFDANLVLSNTSKLIFSTNAGIQANGTFGTSGQTLTTNGSAVYWSSFDATAQFSWTNVHTFNANLIISTSAAIYANNSAGVSGQILTSNGSTVYWSTAPVRVVNVVSSSSITPNVDITDLYVVTSLAANTTFNAPTGTPTDGQKLMIRIKDNGTARTLSWNAIYRVIGLTLPNTTIATKTLYIGTVYNSADIKWDILAVAQE